MTTYEIPTVETERLRLRAPRMADFDAFAAFYETEASRWVGGPFTRAQAFTRFTAVAGQWALRGYGRWLVADKATEEALGVIGVFHPEDWPEPEIGWTVFAAAEGRGIACEAAQATRAYAYGTLGWPSIVSMIAEENLRSQALARRMGAAPERVFQHPDYGPLTVWRHQSAEALS